MIATKHVDDLSVRTDGLGGGAELLGMLMLTAAFAYHGEGAKQEAGTYIAEAKKLAKQTGDTMTLSLFFGPTNVSIWELSLEVDSGDAARAVALARGIDPARIPQVQRQATFHIDTRRALWHLGHDDDAMRMLMEAERLAPAQVHSDARVWRTVRNIVERRPRSLAPSSVQAFCHRLGIAMAHYIDQPADGPAIYLTGFITSRAPDARTAGRLLLRHARTTAGTAGVRLLRLDCYAGGDGALVRYYESVGFEQVTRFSVELFGATYAGCLLEQRLPHDPMELIGRTGTGCTAS